jgi:uncharacterized protein DUF6782
VPFRLRILLSAVVALCIAIVLQPASSAAQVACTFTPSFETLRQQIPAIVGGCLENERVDPVSGAAQQRTGGGLLMRANGGAWVAFTNGLTTWLIGPSGVVSRPAGDHFEWEPVAAPPPVPDAQPTATVPDGSALNGGLPTPVPTDSPFVAVPLPTATATAAPDLAPELAAGYRLLGKVKHSIGDFQDAVETYGLTLKVGDLPKGMLGYFRPSDFLIVINSRVINDSDEATASVLAHEITHARQAKDRPGIYGKDECVRREVEAFTVELKVWDSFDHGTPRTDIQRNYAAMVTYFKQQGTAGLRRAVENSDAYQNECDL